MRNHKIVIENDKYIVQTHLCSPRRHCSADGLHQGTHPPNFENDKVNPAAEGSRVIAVSFGPQTKTSFTSTEDGIQPKFDDKDTILLVSYPEDSEPIKDTCIVSVDDKGIATISTNLTGDLAAIYPAKYACSTKKGYSPIVPSVQTGKFKDANICGTLIREGENSAEFRNISTLFIIEPPTTSVKSLTVKSLNTEQSGQRTGERAQINTSNIAGDNIHIIHVPYGPCDDGKYYVAVATNGKSDVNLSDLSFEVEYEAEGAGAVKGITTSAIATAAGSPAGTEEYDEFNTVALRTAYTIDENNWHGYVTFAGHKWATMNIGANSPEEYGDYFAWGETVGHPLKSDWKDTFDDDKYVNAFVGNYSFEWANCPFTNGIYSDGNKSVFTKYVPESKAGEYGYEGYHDVKTVLDLCDDAANVIWGGPWRMPTKAEAQDFLNNTDKWNDCLGADGCIYFQNIIKVPCSGQVFGPDLWYPINDRLQLWSSTLDESAPKWATILYFDASTPDFSVGKDLRNNGLPIRAIVDDPDYIATEE